MPPWLERETWVGGLSCHSRLADSESLSSGRRTRNCAAVLELLRLPGCNRVLARLRKGVADVAEVLGGVHRQNVQWLPSSAFH